MRPAATSSFRRISFKRGNTLEEEKLKAAEAAEEAKVIPKAPVYKVMVTEESLKREITISDPNDREVYFIIE